MGKKASIFVKKFSRRAHTIVLINDVNLFVRETAPKSLPRLHLVQAETLMPTSVTSIWKSSSSASRAISSSPNQASTPYRDKLKKLSRPAAWNADTASTRCLPILAMTTAPTSKSRQFANCAITIRIWYHRRWKQSANNSSSPASSRADGR
jgi:hypothetical protein